MNCLVLRFSFNYKFPAVASDHNFMTCIGSHPQCTLRGGDKINENCHNSICNVLRLYCFFQVYQFVSVTSTTRTLSVKNTWKPSSLISKLESDTKKQIKMLSMSVSWRFCPPNLVILAFTPSIFVWAFTFNFTKINIWIIVTINMGIFANVNI